MDGTPFSLGSSDGGCGGWPATSVRISGLISPGTETNKSYVVSILMFGSNKAVKPLPLNIGCPLRQRIKNHYMLFWLTYYVFLLRFVTPSIELSCPTYRTKRRDRFLCSGSPSHGAEVVKFIYSMGSTIPLRSQETKQKMKFFLLLPFQQFTWVEKGWITYLWEFVSTTYLEIVYPAQRLPSLPREGDIYLLELFPSNRAKGKEMDIINRCKLYFLEITLSDIATANGCTILPMALQGLLIGGRSSHLAWAQQRWPPKQAWALWNKYLLLFTFNRPQ